MEPDTRSRRTFEYAPGVEVNYEIAGRGARPAVLIHGFGASLEMWRDIQPYLEPHLLLYLVDLKGFGLSSKPRDGCYSIDDHASVMTAFIERLELEDVCLVGHSYGGAVAALTCLQLTGVQSSRRVHSLMLMNAPATIQRLPFFIWPLRNWLLSGMVRLASSRYRARYVLRQISFEAGQVSDERVDRYARFHDLPHCHDAMIATARQIVPADPQQLAERLGTIGVPALLIWGDHDRVVFRWQADLWTKLIPNSKLVVIPRCGHIPPEERPQETAEAMLSFLAG